MIVQPSIDTDNNYIQYLTTHKTNLLNILDTKTQEAAFKHRFKTIPTVSTLAKIIELASQEPPTPKPIQFVAQTHWTHIKKDGDLLESLFITYHDNTIEMVISLKAPIGEGNYKKSSQAIKVTFFKDNIAHPIVEAVAKKTIRLDAT